MTCLASKRTARPRACVAPHDLAARSIPRRGAARRVARNAAMMPRGDVSDSEDEFYYDEYYERQINPATGNPQTGKVIDEYLWLVPLLAVVAVAFSSLGNARDVLQQVGRADSMRAPADRYEWTNLDMRDVYGPCGDAQSSSGAMQDLMEGRPCAPDEYRRVPTRTQTEYYAQ